LFNLFKDKNGGKILENKTKKTPAKHFQDDLRIFPMKVRILSGRKLVGKKWIKNYLVFNVKKCKTCALLKFGVALSDMNRKVFKKISL
jgi:hypothetical protein